MRIYPFHPEPVLSPFLATSSRFSPHGASIPLLGVRIRSLEALGSSCATDLRKGQSSEQSWKPAFQAGTRFSRSDAFSGETGTFLPFSVLEDGFREEAACCQHLLVQVPCCQMCVHTPDWGSASSSRSRPLLPAWNLRFAARRWEPSSAQPSLRHRLTPALGFSPGFCLSCDFDSASGASPTPVTQPDPQVSWQGTSLVDCPGR